ncbi:MAG: hypothetical protein R3E76_10565 [Planctomycetota bacterium]
MRSNLLVLSVLLLAGCVAREQTPVPKSELASLRQELQRIRADHPELMTPEQFSAARVRGSNGWTSIEDIGRRFKEAYDDQGWEWLVLTPPEAWSDQVERLDEKMMVALGETYPMCAEVDAAIACDCLVPVWDDGIEVMPGLQTLNMLKLRAHIQLQRGQYEEARKEVRRMVQIAWRFDGAWCTLGLILEAGFRRLAVEAVLHLTEEDPDSTVVLAEALKVASVESTSLLASSSFDLAHAVQDAQFFLDISHDEWKDRRADPAYEDFTVEQELVMVRESLIEVERVLDLVRANEWRLSEVDDARAYLKAVRAEVARMTPFEWSVVSQDSIIYAAYQLLKNSMVSNTQGILLQMRKLELESKSAVDFVELVDLPNGLEFQDADATVRIVPTAGHPIREWDDWDGEDYVAEYPKLGH